MIRIFMLSVDADSRYMQQLIIEKNAAKYELTENYRSKANIVDFANQWAATIRQRLKSQPGFASKEENGNIAVVQYNGNNLIVPLSSELLAAGLTGSTCILTKTNEEAMLLTGLLVKNGLTAKLIQSNDGFSLYNLYELRYFSDLVLPGEDSSVISAEGWAEAARQLSIHARQSDKLGLAMTAIRLFESINEKRKYKSDWKAFLAESKMEDFVSITAETIYVSTIHKAKGKEFDNVYVLLNRFNPETDELKRQLYVAITRAKTNLQVHYNESFLKKLSVEKMNYSQNNTEFPEPEHLALSLSHRDVNLGYFEFVQQRMNGLQSGSPLTVLNEGLGNPARQLIVKYSNNFKRAMETYFAKGYNLHSARVNFVLYWTNENSVKEAKIILPEIYLSKGL